MRVGRKEGRKEGRNEERSRNRRVGRLGKVNKIRKNEAELGSGETEGGQLEGEG